MRYPRCQIKNKDESFMAFLIHKPLVLTLLLYYLIISFIPALFLWCFLSVSLQLMCPEFPAVLQSFLRLSVGISLPHGGMLLHLRCRWHLRSGYCWNDHLQSDSAEEVSGYLLTGSSGIIPEDTLPLPANVSGTVPDCIHILLNCLYNHL